MTYSVEGYTIKSHNAAKPQNTESKRLLKFIDKYIEPDFCLLDFGCGKLRYSIPLSKKMKKVVAVDSSEQLFRKIKINNVTTTVIDNSKLHNNIEVYEVQNNDWKKIDYNLVVLIHVLSAIPKDEDRNIIINQIYEAINTECRIICCNNHRMSYFKKWENSDKVFLYNDGYLVKQPVPSYFGKISNIKLKSYFPKNKFLIEEEIIIEDNTIIVFKKKSI